MTEAVLKPALHRLFQGRTVIVIAHCLALLDRVDDILVLEEGRVVEHGTRTALAADPRSRFAGLRQRSPLEIPR